MQHRVFTGWLRVVVALSRARRSILLRWNWRGGCAAWIGEVGAYDHSASTRILAAFTAASRRSFFRCGANALRSLC